MAKFNYSLETLLRYRAEVEDRERDELHRLTYRHQIEETIRTGLTAKLNETMHDLAAACGDNSRDRELTWFHLYLNRLTREIGDSEKRSARLKSEIEAQKQAVIEASKNRKTLSSMKSKKEKEFFAEQEKREQKDIDELVVARYGKTDSSQRITMKIRDVDVVAKNER